LSQKSEASSGCDDADRKFQANHLKAQDVFGRIDVVRRWMRMAGRITGVRFGFAFCSTSRKKPGATAKVGLVWCGKLGAASLAAAAKAGIAIEVRDGR
jgi:hypothetical protein